jgi:hypothetical protein
MEPNKYDIPSCVHDETTFVVQKKGYIAIFCLEYITIGNLKGYMGLDE